MNSTANRSVLSERNTSNLNISAVSTKTAEDKNATLTASDHHKIELRKQYKNYLLSNNIVNIHKIVVSRSTGVF